jgi:hypothetical protein
LFQVDTIPHHPEFYQSGQPLAWQATPYEAVPARKRVQSAEYETVQIWAPAVDSDRNSTPNSHWAVQVHQSRQL